MVSVARWQHCSQIFFYKIYLVKKHTIENNSTTYEPRGLHICAYFLKALIWKPYIVKHFSCLFDFVKTKIYLIILATIFY
jgi:hypothetical protein